MTKPLTLSAQAVLDACVRRLASKRRVAIAAALRARGWVMNSRAQLVLTIAAILSLHLWVAAYFLPRKWLVCRVLYADRPAQIICLLSR